MVNITVSKKEVTDDVLGKAAQGDDQWKPGSQDKEGAGISPGDGKIKGESSDFTQQTLTPEQIVGNRKLIKGAYIGLVAGTRVILKLPEDFKALPEEIEALQDAWELLIPPGYELPKALIITVEILGEKAAQAMALRKEAQQKQKDAGSETKTEKRAEAAV